QAIADLDYAATRFTAATREVQAKAARIYVDAVEYLRSDDVTWPLSAVPLCHHFGIDVDAMREHLRLPTVEEVHREFPEVRLAEERERERQAIIDKVRSVLAREPVAAWTCREVGG